MLAKNTHDKYRKNNKCNKIPDGKEKRQEGPRSVRKYRKNRRSNKDFSCELKTPMSINIAKVAKITNLTRIKA